MNRSTPAWTELHTRLALVLVAAVLTASLTAADATPWTAPLMGALTIAVILAGVLFEVYVALIVAVIAAGLMIAVQQAAGAWFAQEFALNVAKVALLIASAAAGRLLGKSLGRARSTADERAHEAEPVFGSLGLLRADLGEARLTEELERARRFGRPLSVLRVETVPDPQHQSQREIREGVTRGVARVLESVLYATDVPYAYRDSVVIAILPETNETQVQLLVGRLEGVLARTSFLMRPNAERYCVSDYADVTIGTATFPQDGEHCDDLLEASEEKRRPLSRQLVEQARRPQAVGHD